jgi:SNF2 family DNA or RNA helicase
MGDPTLGDRTVFRRAVSQPIKEGDDQGLSRLRSMMKHIALRRNKSTANIELAEKTVELRSVEFAPGNPHYDIYQTIYKSAKLAVQATMQGKAKESDKALLTHGSVFEILTRMRQACCSGKLVPQDRLERAEQVLAAIENKESLTAEEGKELLDKLKGVLQAEDDSPPECAICFDVMTEDAATVLRVCGHVFCASCLGKVSEGAHSKCPLCRHDFQQNDMVKWSSAVAAASSVAAPVVALSQHMDEMCPSPKLEALLLGLREMKDGEKGVIFSQFTKFLDEIQKFLDEHHYTYTRIDGSRTATQRIAAMKEFGRDDGGPMFMLCSLHAAGTGLNLTRGNHIFMMDTWFNLAGTCGS